MYRFILIALVSVFTAYAPAQVMAQDSHPPAEDVAETLTEEQAALAESYVQATRQADLGVFWKLVHPVNFQCQGELYRKLIEVQEFGWLINAPIPEKYIAQVVPVEKEKVTGWYDFLFGPKTAIPVMPTHAIILSYEQPRGLCRPKPQRRVVFTARHDDGKWYEVFPCPKTLPMSPDTFRLKMASMKLNADGYLMSLPGEFKDRITNILVRDKAVDYATELLTRDKGISPEVAEFIIDDICQKDGGKKGNQAH